MDELFAYYVIVKQILGEGKKIKLKAEKEIRRGFFPRKRSNNKEYRSL